MALFDSLDYSADILSTVQSYSERDEVQGESFLPGFPSRFKGARVWTGLEMSAHEQAWTIILSNIDLEHITRALLHFQSLGIGPEKLSPETFPLPSHLHDRLRGIAHAVYEGRGFGVLRGLQPERFTQEENILIFAGVSSHVAPTRGFQDVKRELVTCHIVSEELRPGAKEQNLRPAFTNERLAFHTDVGDVLSLFVLDVPSSGGETMIVSSPHIYNELAVTRPDLLQELGKKWVSFASQDYYTDGSPLINIASGDKLVLQYSRLPITGFRNKGANPTIPAPSPKRLEAMALLEDLAWKHAMPLPGKAGDITYVNNLCLMHARREFDLDSKGGPLPSKRHLVKMMLRDPELAWELPESLSWYTRRVYGPNRDDSGREEKWQLNISNDGALPSGHVWAGSGSFTNG